MAVGVAVGTDVGVGVAVGVGDNVGSGVGTSVGIGSGVDVDPGIGLGLSVQAIRTTEIARNVMNASQCILPLYPLILVG